MKILVRDCHRLFLPSRDIGQGSRRGGAEGKSGRHADDCYVHGDPQNK